MLHAVPFLQTLLNIRAMCIYLILHLHTICTLDFCYFTTKWPKWGTNSKKPNIFFCFTEYKYVAYLLNQHKQLTNGRNVYAFGQTSYPPSSLSRISALLMESNLKMSTILLVLLYIRFKGRVKSQIWDSKLYPWLHRQVNHPLQRQMHLFLHIFETIFCAC